MDFKMNKYKYNLIINSIIFDEHKQEKDVFDLLVKGYTIIEIGNILGMCERTVYRRKKELKKKLLSLF